MVSLAIKVSCSKVIDFHVIHNVGSLGLIRFGKNCDHWKPCLALIAAAAVVPQRVEHLEVEAGLLLPLGPERVVSLVLVPVPLHDDLAKELVEAVVVRLRDEAAGNRSLDAPVRDVAKGLRLRGLM